MKPNKEGKDIILCHYDIISITSFSVAIDYLLNNVKLTQGVYSSSCGNGMHMECWRLFHDSRIMELQCYSSAGVQ